MYYIGVDLGTSAVKLLLMDGSGKIMNIVSREYPLSFPHPGWSEQKPEDWWEQSKEGIKELTEGFDKSQVAGISFGGQMHGLVILDSEDHVIRPAILWNDGRTQKQTDYLNNEIGKDKLSQYTANIAFAGFTAPKILWVKENEPENFAKICKIMLPKDYLAYKLSGSFCTDYSDASGMLLLDVEHKCWSKEMMEICGIREEQLAKLYESYEVVGTLKPEVAAELGLPESCKVVASRRQCCSRSRNRNGRRRNVQCFPGNQRNDLYLQREFRCGQQQCPPCICSCRRTLSSDGMHAERGFLQQMVDGRDHRHEGLFRRAGED